MHVADEHLRAADGLGAPIVVLETALPIKFADTIVEAIGMVPPHPARFEGIEDLPRRVVSIPNDADALRALIDAS